MGRALWQLLLTGARRIGQLQTWLLLTVFYVVCLAPAALVFRIVADPLRLRRSSSNEWQPKVPPAELTAWSKSQF